MTVKKTDKSEIFKIVFDAIPSLIFVVNEDVRIQEYNTAAAKLLSADRKTVLKRRGGEVLNCLHSKEVPEGCGRAPFCKNCVIRNSVNATFQGNSIVRRRTRIEIIQGDDKLEIYSLITTSPFQFLGKKLVLLVIEDISEIAELKRLIPICSICHEIRNPEKTWSKLEAYFKDQWDVDFSHGFCPKCADDWLKKQRKILKNSPNSH
ncbi:hypothetical protein BVX93_02200 [bacterium B13(2017)]|nr:hypothetical protein BVX93_02200 [bacterium B13(2017)]